MKKRGQVTAFIIIGLLILIVIAGVIIIKQEIVQKYFEKIKLTKRLPEEIKPVQEFLDSCTAQVSKEGIELVASQGGYLNLPIDNIPTTSFTPIPATLEIIPGSDLKAPLWFRETPNGIPEINIPTKIDVEDSISKYVNRRFALCVNNLTTFTDQGYIFTAQRNPKTTTTLKEDKIVVSIDYPLEVQGKIANFSLGNYNADIDSGLGKLYNAAKEIMESENEGLFLENKTIDLLIAYDPEIPYSGIDISCNEKIWYKPEVELKLKNILFENTAAITVKDSGAETLDNLKYLQFDAFKSSHKDVDVNFMYIPDWPTVIEINPHEGNILRSDQITKKIGGAASALLSTFVCINQHRFVYTLKYPVLITLNDKKTGLTFQFATEVIIKNNNPREYNLPLNDVPDTDNQICKYPQKEATIYTATFDENAELKPLGGVTLTYKCATASCPLGESEKKSEEPKIDTKLPLCLNGIIEGRKEGYYAGKTVYSTNLKTEQNLIVALEPLYKKKVHIKVIDKDTGNIREPYDSEQISFQFNHKNVDYSASYNTLFEKEEIELLAGEYSITSYVIRNSTWPVITQKETIENCVDSRGLGIIGFFKTTKHCEKVEIPSRTFDYVMTGGGIFDNNFTRTDLANNGDLTLYTLADPTPGDIETMQNIQLELYTNKDHPLFRRPEIS